MAKGVRSARKKSFKFSHALVMFFIAAIMSMGVVSMLRGDSQALDGQISALQTRLALCEKECRELEREAAAMMSPRAVHSAATAKLGMSQVRLAGSLRVDGAVRTDKTAMAALSNVARGYQD